jgi:hypothetical protein
MGRIWGCKWEFRGRCEGSQLENRKNREMLKNLNLKHCSVLRKEKRLTFLRAVFYILVGCAGIEPTTNGLKVRCSTS